MEIVLIDEFNVPPAAREAFLERARGVQTFLRTLPGFVEGHLYERTQGEASDFVTTAVWRDEAAYRNARDQAAQEFERQGLDPAEFREKNHITARRGLFQRSSY
ncbi:MAG TPA: antibiotic biosynthesis monooxygenase family protein [bacterium]|nr:antibiotic biosynthesis monooxygenase family protein [bacterium]